MGHIIGRCGVCKKRLTPANSFEKEDGHLYCRSCNMRAVRHMTHKTVRKKNDDKDREWRRGIY